MKFGSVCSGIEAASVAFGPLGWEAAWYSEIEPFPAAVLAHHYPGVPNLGDMTRIHTDERLARTAVDALCGGTPCQSFSIAGLRKGLADDRGNLSLIFCKLAHQLRRENGLRWVLWENVPGVLSDKGNAFGCFLAALSGADAPLVPDTRDGRWANAGIVRPEGKKGFGLAWRVLDAQHFGVPQRRRRVFVVGYFGDWRPAAEVLFERKGVCGDIATGRETGQSPARDASPRAGADDGHRTFSTPAIGVLKSDPISSCLTKNSGGGGESQNAAFVVEGKEWPAKVAPTLDAHYGDKQGLEDQHINGGDVCSSSEVVVMAHGQGGAEVMKGKCPTLNCNHEAPIVLEERKDDNS